MAKYDLTEAEAWTIITQSVNFGMTQVVDGNWGVHAVIPKSIFEGVTRPCSGEGIPVDATGEEEIESEETSDARGISLFVSPFALALVVQLLLI